MARSLEDFGKRVMSGSATGLRATLLRGVMSAAEPIYAAAVRRRNRRYDNATDCVVRLDRPVISVGNITTGGTGKTPAVRWLCQSLLAQGVRPAVLLRGYRATDTGGSDEQIMLSQFLDEQGVTIKANPDRVAAAGEVLAADAAVQAFVLDDGFQHRRVARDLDIVLISAVEPFGFGRLLPRGLLREPLSGLSRAAAIIITHARQVTDLQRLNIQTRLRQYNTYAPIYHADHAPLGFRSASRRSSEPIEHQSAALVDQPIMVVCGLGDPRIFERQLATLGARIVATRRFKDHHDYTPADLGAVRDQAVAAGAQIIITTEKDWVKLATLPSPADGPSIWRLDVALQFWGNDEQQLIERVRQAVNLGKPNSA